MMLLLAALLQQLHHRPVPRNGRRCGATKALAGGARRRGAGHTRMDISGLRGVDPEERMATLAIRLPEPAPAAANCVPYVVTDNYAYFAAQLPAAEGQVVHTGRVPSVTSVEQGYESARLSALNLVAQMKAACNGDLKKVKRIIKLQGLVHSDADFQEHDRVMDGASDLIMQVKCVVLEEVGLKGCGLRASRSGRIGLSVRTRGNKKCEHASAHAAIM